MAITFVGQVAATGFAGTLTKAYTSTARNTLILSLQHQTFPSPTITDTAGNTWIQGPDTVADGTGAPAEKQVGIWYVFNALPITSISVTTSGVGSRAIQFNLSEWRGIGSLRAKSSAYAASGTTNSAAAPVSALTGDLVIGNMGYYDGTGRDDTLVSGYIALTGNAIATTYQSAGYSIVTVTAPAEPTYTYARNTQSGIAVASFAPATVKTIGIAGTATFNPTGFQDPSTSGGGAVIPIPSGAVVGQYVIAAVYFAQGTGNGSIIKPANWTVLNPAGGTAANHLLVLYGYKIVDSTALSNLGTSFLARVGFAQTRVTAITHLLNNVDLNADASIGALEFYAAAYGSSVTFNAPATGDYTLYFPATNSPSPTPNAIMTSVGGTKNVQSQSLDNTGGTSSDSQLSSMTGGTGATFSAPVQNHMSWGAGYMAAFAANVAPTAAFTHSESGLITSVNGTTSTDSDGTIATYDWDWGDGTAHGTVAVTTHTYSAVGTYSIVLTVTDNGGLTNTSTQIVTFVVYDPLAFTPTYDTPTITTGAAGAFAVTTLSGSAGWLREKRNGVAEVAAGASQSSTAGLDLTGSTRFNYRDIPQAIGNPANAGVYVQTTLKPGSTAALQNAKWLMNLEFVTSSSIVQIKLRAAVANPSLGSVVVNGLRVQDHAFPSSGIAAGDGYYMQLQFPDSRSRTILVRGLNSVTGDFGGVAVQSGYTVVKPTPTITRRIAFITDSYGNGASVYPDGASSTETFIWQLGLKMGADDIIAAGIGATGWLATLSGQPTSNFAGRISAVMAMNPHVVIFAGGRNDSATGLQTAVESAFDAVGSAVERYVLRTSSNTSTSVNAAIAAGAASRSVKYLNLDIDSLPKIADGIHPTFVGHQTLATNAYNALVNVAPTAAFTHSEIGLTTSVNGTTSTDSDGTITAYDWDWGDATAHGAGSTSIHTYATAGTFTAILTVTDNGGMTATISSSITVTAPTRPVIVGTPTTAMQTVTTTLSLTISKPAGVADGDWLIACLRNQDANATADFALAGWTRVGTGFVANSTGGRDSGFYAKYIPTASAETVTSYTFTWAGGGGRAVGVIIRVQGADPVNLIDAYASPYVSTTITNGQRLSSYSVPHANGLQLAIAMNEQTSPNASETVSVTAGYALVQSIFSSAGTSVSRTTLELYQKNQDVGSTAQMDVTWVTTSSSNIQSIVLKKATATATATPVPHFATGDYATSTSGLAAAITVLKPTNTADGDLLVACIYNQSTVGASFTTVPVGWILRYAFVARRGGIYTRYITSATAESATSYSWSGASSGRIVGTIFRVTNADPSNPIDVVGTELATDASNATSLTIPSVTPTQINDLLLNFNYWNNSTPTTVSVFSAAAGMIDGLQTVSPTGGSANTSGTDIQYQFLSTASATGTRTPTLSPSGVSDNGILVTIRPATTSSVVGYSGLYRDTGGVNHVGSLFYWDGATKHSITAQPQRAFAPMTVSTFLSPARAPWFVAHRGGSYNYPEETLYAYKAATTWGIHAIEISVQYSADGTPWCFHDPTTTRTTGVSGTISAMTDVTIAALNNLGSTATGNSGQPSQPTAKLVDVLNLYYTTHVIIVEDKTYAHTTSMLNLMDSYGTVGRPANEIFIWKADALASKSTYYDPPAARGYHRWAYIFDTSMAANFSTLVTSGKADMIGMDYASSDATLTPAIAACIANNVMPTAHILSTAAQRDHLISLGMQGMMIANVLAVTPPWYLT